MPTLMMGVAIQKRYQPAPSAIEKYTDSHQMHTTLRNFQREIFGAEQWRTQSDSLIDGLVTKKKTKKVIVIYTSFVRIFIVEISSHLLRNGNRINWLTWNFNLTYRKFAADPIVFHRMCAMCVYFTISSDDDIGRCYHIVCAERGK